MKKFRVGLFEEIGGYATVEAKDKIKAEEKAYDLLSAEGVTAFKDFDSTHRDVFVIGVEEEK